MSLNELRKKFSIADPRFGPVPFWWWSAEEVTAERVRWQLQKFRGGGLRNIGIINIAPTGPQYGSVSDNPAYFSEQWWNMFEVAVREAERLGMHIFFYDQIGFSGSNFPARIVSENPECAGYILRRIPIGEALPDEASLLQVTHEFQYVSVRQGFNWLNPEATAKLIDMVHGEFERRFPNDLGRTIAGSFQDELPPLPLWSEKMPQLYKERFEEDLLSLLPALFDDSPISGQVRRQVYEIAAELAEESFFKPLAKWHEKYDMLLCCDQAGPARRADIHGAQRLYLDYFRTHRWYSAAGSDMDGEIKPHSSMVHLHGGKRVFLEAFHTSGWGGTLEETMHWLIPWLQAGATLYSPHSVYYSTRGGWWEWAPPDTGWRQPYFENYQVFADTVSRVCALLSEGTHVADIAVHYPSHAVSGFMSLADGEDSEHPMSVSNRMPNEALNHIDEVYRRITGRWNRKEQKNLGVLREARLDYDIADDSALEKANIENGKLRIADERFSVLILCGTTMMDDAAKGKVETWIQDGGMVIAVNVPESEKRLEGAHYLDKAEETIGLIKGHVQSRLEGNGMSLHRQTADADIFLLLPDEGQLLMMHEPASSDYTFKEKSTYELQTMGEPELWNPVTGETHSLHHTRNGSWIEVEVPFVDWPAALIICPFEKQDRETGTGQFKHASNSMHPRPASVSQNPEKAVRREIPGDSWEVLAVPTLDNRYGDFDLHGEKPQFLSIERRLFKVQREQDSGSGENAGWHLGDYDDISWESRLWSEGSYWQACKGETFNEGKAWKIAYSNTFGDLKFRTWAGRMGRVPRRFLNLGEVEQGETVWAKTNILAPSQGRYWIRIESNVKIRGWVNGEEVELYGGPEEQTCWAELQEGSNEFVLRAEAIVKGLIRAGVEVCEQERPSLPKWIFVKQPTHHSTLCKCIHSSTEHKILRVRMVFAARGRVALYVNGNKVTEHGDFNPYIRQGQEEVDITSLWKQGNNEIKFVLPEGTGEVLCDGVIELFNGETISFCTGEDWQDNNGSVPELLHEAVLQFAETETLWLSSRPHPLPNVGWLMPDSVPDPKPLAFHCHPEEGLKPIWLRFPLPIGTSAMKLDCAGSFRVWIDGQEKSVQNGRVRFPPQAAGTVAAIRVIPDVSSEDADILKSPIRFEVSKTHGSVGDWRSVLCLPHHSGAVEYETTVTLKGSAKGSAQKALDLGHVRGTAEAWLDGKPLGVRLWRPFRFDLGQKVEPGSHRLRIRVTNTLGTHYEIGRPSSNVGGNPDKRVSFWSQEMDESWSDTFGSGGLYGPVEIIEKG
ncbi:hypothetical protein J7E71_18080 [Mesobacillus foraminis]|uniref:hypothetical protein n=1 Tax=Mesobacillus foraminis TaxID=279826 RepID=UPI001BE97B7D|nr:hypothetical protein [Mesobacillus foraminis]MBT2757797.1 hypothetical protein [Mesobacillus foraminis]